MFVVYSISFFNYLFAYKVVSIYLTFFLAEIELDIFFTDFDTQHALWTFLSMVFC